MVHLVHQEKFKSHVGSSREEIERDIRILELKIQNPKIIRGLSLIMFRLSRMIPPGNLDAELVRSTIFKYAMVPPVSPEGREDILARVAEELKSTVNEVGKCHDLSPGHYRYTHLQNCPDDNYTLLFPECFSD